MIVKNIYIEIRDFDYMPIKKQLYIAFVYLKSFETCFGKKSIYNETFCLC